MRLAISALVLSLVASAAPMRAQVTLALATDVRGRPGGSVVALLSPGIKLTTGAQNLEQISVDGVTIKFFFRRRHALLSNDHTNILKRQYS